MTAQEMWMKFTEKSNLQNEKYTAWAFGDTPDELAELVLKGIKTATSSLYCLYDIKENKLSKVGEYNIVLNSKNEAVCIIKTTTISIIPFNKITEQQAIAEGDGNLNNWKKIHRDFYTDCLKVYDIKFEENTELVFEEFELVYK